MIFFYRVILRIGLKFGRTEGAAAFLTMHESELKPQGRRSSGSSLNTQSETKDSAAWWDLSINEGNPRAEKL